MLTYDDLNPDQKVAAAEAVLERARIDARAEQHGRLAKRLREIVRELERCEKEFAAVSSQIKTEDLLYDQLQHRIKQYLEAIGRSASQKPQSALYLAPEESEEVRLWLQNHQELESKLAELVQARDGLHRSDRIAAIDLGKHCEELRFAKLNTLNALNGSIGHLEKGGIHSVG